MRMPMENFVPSSQWLLQAADRACHACSPEPNRAGKIRGRFPHCVPTRQAGEVNTLMGLVNDQSLTFASTPKNSLCGSRMALSRLGGIATILLIASALALGQPTRADDSGEKENLGRQHGISPGSEKGIVRERLREMPGGMSMAILIGVKNYTGLPALKYADADVELLARTLKERCNFDKVITLTESSEPLYRPLQGNILRQLRTHLPLADRGGYRRVLVYFSGHGFRDKNGELYFAPPDCDLNFIEQTAIKQSVVKKLLDDCTQVPIKLLVLDCCHAGETKDAKGTGATGEQLAAVFANAKGLLTFASCKNDEVSLEWEEKQQGLFTYWLCEGLKGMADENRNGVINVSELHHFVYNRVWATSTGLGREQNVVLRPSDDWQGDAVLSSVQGSVVRNDEEQEDPSPLAQRKMEIPHMLPESSLAMVVHVRRILDGPMGRILPPAELNRSLGKVERFILFAVPAQNGESGGSPVASYGSVIQFHDQFSAEDFVAQLARDSLQGRHKVRNQPQSTVYYYSQDENDAAFQADRRTVVIGPKAEITRMMENAKPDNDLALRLAKMKPDVDVAFVVHLKPWQAALRRSNLDDTFSLGLKSLMAATDEAETATFVGNLAEPSQLLLTLESPDGKTASELERSLADVSSILLSDLKDARSRTDSNGRREVLFTLSQMLRQVRFQRDGDSVVASLEKLESFWDGLTDLREFLVLLEVDPGEYAARDSTEGGEGPPVQHLPAQDESNSTQAPAHCVLVNAANQHGASLHYRTFGGSGGGVLQPGQHVVVLAAPSMEYFDGQRWVSIPVEGARGVTFSVAVIGNMSVWRHRVEVDDH